MPSAVYRNGVYLTSTTSPGYTCGSLLAGTSYCFAVAAYDTYGARSQQSTNACATTQPATCTYALSSSSASAAASGASGSVNVTAGASCAWTPFSSATWLTCTPATGTGSGALAWTADANTLLSSRTAALSVGGQNFTVTPEPIDDDP